jgi:hypothetical protein
VRIISAVHRNQPQQRLFQLFFSAAISAAGFPLPSRPCPAWWRTASRHGSTPVWLMW